MTKTVLETALDEEMNEHLGYDKHSIEGNNSGNSRNRTRSKTVLTDNVGPVQIEVPRDRNGSFEPVVVKKIIAGTGGADLQSLINSGAFSRGFSPFAPPQAELRRPPLETVSTYRLRVDLDYARPPIWRRLELRSDLTLDRVHDIIQTAFGWWDTHLHIFTLGGRAYDRSVENFLCPFDVEEGESPGTPESAVRLDETIQEVGDKLFYLYDYGDDWGHTIKLEAVLPRQSNTPDAWCTGGRRAAPPEDCGGLRDAASL